jgi:hypothetical protein
MTVIEPAEIFLARSWQVNAGLVKYLLVKVPAHHLKRCSFDKTETLAN